ncbi:hypothetical protein ANAPC2_01387 [Anaplasma phagocytophilum]|nr:hypothetical protein ANAPC4_00541 [Anaplasma phagocytophilum]SBO33542.1 hypothetical protein ANAPC2_01387 [Anaplasma phagocytophilum]
MMLLIVRLISLLLLLPILLVRTLLNLLRLLIFLIPTLVRRFVRRSKGGRLVTNRMGSTRTLRGEETPKTQHCVVVLPARPMMTGTRNNSI